MTVREKKGIIRLKRESQSRLTDSENKGEKMKREKVNYGKAGYYVIYQLSNRGRGWVAESCFTEKEEVVSEKRRLERNNPGRRFRYRKQEYVSGLDWQYMGLA